MKAFTVVVLTIGLIPFALAEDWPMWGRDHTRNMVSPEKNPPTDWESEVRDKDDKIVRAARNIKWSAALGSASLFSPVISNGLVWVATNNGNPRDPQLKRDAGVLMCFGEKDGKFLWQYVSPRLPDNDNDWPMNCLGCPLVEGDRLWFITNRNEAVCLDIAPLRAGAGEPKVLWKVDMQKDYGVFRHNGGMGAGLASASVALYRDRVLLPTGNGVDESHVKVPAPRAPSLICLSKTTGKEIWKENSPGKDILHEQCSPPTVIEADGKGQVIMPHGDGWLRSFDVETGKLLWKCDANPKGSKYDLGGRGTKSYFMASPVWHGDRLYIGTGQDPEHYEGVGWLLCIDPTKRGDISFELEDPPGKGKLNPNSGVVWRYGGPTTKEDREKLNRDYYYGRTLSNCVVHDGLVYANEIAGYLHCLDARTGKAHWVYDLKASPWGSPIWVDGKIYLATEDADVWIFTHGKEKKEPRKIEMPEAIRSTLVFANGVLYLATESRLYAIQENREKDKVNDNDKDKPRSRGPRPPFVPTPHDVVEKMLELAQVKQTDTVVDLGCGDGRIVVAAAKKYACKAIGYDLDKECLRLARENVKKNQLEERVQIIEDDIINVDLSKVDVVTLYLWPTTNVKLIPQFEKMKPGSRIVSHAADMKGVVPDKVITVKSKDDDQERKLYLWTVPLKKAEPSK